MSLQQSDLIEFYGAGVDVIITEMAQTSLCKYYQTVEMSEAGGMLFGTINSSTVVIEEISTPSIKDKRTSTKFIWHKGMANKKIIEFHNKGLHYLGDWHTHSQVYPKPSPEDISSIRSTFNESKHDLNFFILFILSNSDIKNSFVALSDGVKEYVLNAR